MRGVILLCCLAFACAIKVSYEGYKVLRVKTPDDASVEFVRALTQLKVQLLLEPNTKRDSEIAVPPNVYDEVEGKLRDEGINFTVINDNLQKEADAQLEASNRKKNRVSFSRTFDNDYNTIATYFPTYRETNNWLYSLQRQYPSLAKVELIGKSFEGNDQVAIKIGSHDCNKLVIWIDGAIHAREWATVPTVLYLASKLLAKYDSTESGESTKSLLDKYDFYFLPIFNPDGYNHTHEQDRFWRKNRRPMADDCYGADLNRNFGHHWAEVGASPNPCDETYPGTAAFSEIESRNVRDALRRFRGRFQMYMNLHTYGEMLFYPYGYSTSAEFDRLDEHVRIAEEFGRAIYYSSDKRRVYDFGKVGNLLYNAAGGVFDWAYAEADANFSFAVELSPRDAQSGGFVVSPDDVPEIAEGVYRGVKAALEAM